MFLAGPNSCVRTLCISKSLLKSLLFSISGILVICACLLYKYYDVKERAWELQSKREEIMRQRAQVQTFALNLIEYKRQMFLARGLDAKLRRAVSLYPENKTQQFLGIGGPDELGLQNLVAIGEKKQDEALKEMHQELTLLQSAASKQETSLQTLMEYFEDKHSLYASTPAAWPVRGWVTSPFGSRVSPLNGRTQFHEGIDIAVETGTPVSAPADGVVVRAGFAAGYGIMVEINHGYGLKTVFGHNSQVNVKPGQHVRRGDVISYSGSTGSSTGPHVHYEVRLKGLPVNPIHYLPN